MSVSSSIQDTTPIREDDIEQRQSSPVSPPLVDSDADSTSSSSFSSDSDRSSPDIAASSRTSVFCEYEDQDTNDVRRINISVTEDEYEAILRMRAQRAQQVEWPFESGRLSSHPTRTIIEGSEFCEEPAEYEIKRPSVFALASDFEVSGGDFAAVSGNQTIRCIQSQSYADDTNVDDDTGNDDEPFNDHINDDSEEAAHSQALALRENFRDTAPYSSSHRSTRVHPHAQVPDYLISGPSVLAYSKSFKFHGSRVSPGAFCAVGGNQVIYA